MDNVSRWIVGIGGTVVAAIVALAVFVHPATTPGAGTAPGLPAIAACITSAQCRVLPAFGGVRCFL